MSAFICNPRHIATCAEFIVDRQRHSNLKRPDVAVELARENVASVAFRYGPTGQAIYAELIGATVGEAAATVEAITSKATRGFSPGAEATVADMLPEGQTTAEYIAACRFAEPVDCMSTEAFMHLQCLDYQSCEHPEWQGSQAQEWIRRACMSLAYDIVRASLRDRHVWEVKA